MSNAKVKPIGGFRTNSEALTGQNIASIFDNNPATTEKKLKISNYEMRRKSECIFRAIFVGANSKSTK